MKLTVLGSSSKGNGYLLDNGKEALLIECGVPYIEIQKAVNFDTSRIKCALVSHEHGDHAKHVKKCLDAQIPVYCSIGTAEALNLSNNRLVNKMDDCDITNIGGFTVQAFETEHDAKQPFGFLIYHNECGTILFATDTYYLQYKFDNLSNILIECNYKQEILDSNIDAGFLPKTLRKRTMKSHMEYETCKETLLANDLTATNNIVLIHLSGNNADEAEFKKGIEEATGKKVHIAKRGLVIENFNKSPF